MAKSAVRANQLCAWILQRFCSQPSMATQSSSGMGTASSSSSHPAAPPLPEDPNPQGGGGAQGAAQDLRAFCREALYECITEEKPGSLASYLLLYSLMQGIMGGSHSPGTPRGPLGGGGWELGRVGSLFFFGNGNLIRVNLKLHDIDGLVRH